MKALGDGDGIEFNEDEDKSNNKKSNSSTSGKNVKNSIEYRIKDKAEMAEELGIGEITLSDIVKELEKPEEIHVMRCQNLYFVQMCLK